VSDLHHELARLRALVDATRLVFSSLELDELLDNILRAATTMVGAARGTVYICDHRKGELWSRVTAGDERVEIRLPFGQGMAGHTAQTGEVVRVDDVRQSPLFDPETDRRTGFHTRNALCVPIRDRAGAVAAVIQLLNKVEGFAEADEEFLGRMGLAVAQALANAQAQQILLERQRLQKEMEVARGIQTLLLPAALPDRPGLDMAARMVPCRGIGGDYYDAVPVDGRRTLLVVADVSGKGVPAALVMSNLQAALWATADLRLTLERWAQHLNTLLYRRLEGTKYVTAFLLLLEADGIHGRYVNAGHPSGLVAGGGDRTIRRLDSTGPPLGLLPDRTYSAGDLTLDAGDVALLYSDGLSEATDTDGRELGPEGLETLLRAVPQESAEATASRLMECVEAFADPLVEGDDRTLLVVRRT
jgi:sigma-B regulation protein RsbU (phosphoserine phosphatase)